MYVLRSADISLVGIRQRGRDEVWRRLRPPRERRVRPGHHALLPEGAPGHPAEEQV